MRKQGPNATDRELLSRRTILRGSLLGAGVVAFPSLLAACGDDDDEGTTGDTGGTTVASAAGSDTTAGGSAATGQLEVFSWWTGGGEAAGLEAMIEIWKTQYPDVEFVNAAVAGGAGSNAKAVLAQRLEADDPPDSFQGHAGAELQDYIVAEQLEPLNFLYDEQGFNEVFPTQLVEQISVGGEVFSVPVNIHRANVLWFNPATLETAGLSEPPADWDAFVAALDTLAGTDVQPLSMAEQWTAKHLLETVMISTLKGPAWAALWKKGGDWAAADVTTSLENFSTVLGFTNSDAASLTWQEASKLVIDGLAGFNVMGDWAAGYFDVDLAKTAETDYGYIAVPGTEGIYDWLSDSFTLPKGAKNRDAAIEWLKLCGSKEGQDAFNPQKGSIPARNDADTSLYGTYLQSALADWTSSELAGSLAHGVVANNAWNLDIDGALGAFLQDTNVEKFQEALVTAAEKHAV